MASGISTGADIPLACDTLLPQVDCLTNLTDNTVVSYLAVVLDKARGQDEGFEIYDARCTSQGVVWTEANIMDGTWRIFAGKLNSNGDALSNIQQLDEGSTDQFETPTIAAVGGHAFWQVMPQSDSTVVAASLIAQLKSASMGSSDANVVYESAGRMATAPYAAGDGVVITPRVTGASLIKKW